MDRLLQYLQPDKPAIIAGDFNLHHPWWNCTASPAKASKAMKLVKWLEAMKATLLINTEEINLKGGTYHKPGLKSTSIIDLAFYTSFKKLVWGKWSFTEHTGSDHEAITFEASLAESPQSTNTETRKPNYNYKKADWNQFCTTLRAMEHGLLETIETAIREKQHNQIAEVLTSAIQLAADQTIPRLRVVERSKPWWNEDLANLRKLLHNAYRRYKQFPDDMLFLQDWKEVRNTYFHAVREAKQAHWSNFLELAEGAEVFTAFRYTKPASNLKIPTIQYESEGRKVQASTFEEKCTAFLTTLFPTPTNTTPTTNTSQPQKSTCSASKATSKSSGTSQWDWPDLDDTEVKRAIFSSSAKKAPGPDQVGFLLIQKAYQTIPDIFNKVYKTLFRDGVHPNCWKESIGIILSKPNKPDYTIPKAYRVISLLNCLGKVLEKLFASRLAYLANTGNLLNSTQLGGRKQRSAVDTALLLLHYIQQHKKGSSSITTTVLLDIKGAFDHVKEDKLLQILHELQLPDNLISWVSSFLTNRKIQLAFEGQIQQLVDLNIGVPQGSPISPILFLIYIRNILADNQAYQLSYIDDFSLSVTSSSAKKNCRQIKEVVDKLFAAATQQGAQFDPGKTELIHFSTKREVITEGVKIANLTITPSPVVRWLGIYFDSKLTFKPHIEKKVNSATSAFLGLQRLGNTRSGLSFKALRQLYIACITSVADYGVQLWWRGQKGLLQPFQTLQNMATTRMLGAFKNSPAKALELEAAIPPPRIRFEKACNNYSLRILQFLDSHPVKKACYSLVQDELQDAEDLATMQYIQSTTQLTSLLSRLQGLTGNNWKVEKAAADWTPPWAAESLATTYVSKNSKEDAKEEHQQLLKSVLKSPNWVFYTDGSQGQSNQGVLSNSAAICRLDKDLQPNLAKYWNLGPNIEVADAEITAINKVLITVLATPRNQRPPACYIFCDSQAAILKLNNYSYLAQKAKSYIRQLSDHGTTIYIHWCPSHCNIQGNELADALAKQGLDSDPGPEAFISFSHLRREAKADVISKWQQDWYFEQEREEQGLKARGLGTQYRLLVEGKLSFSLKPKLPNLPRKHQSAYIQLKTGIGNLRPYLVKIGKADSRACRQGCEEEENTEHLVLCCTKYNKERKKMKKDLEGLPLTLQILFCTMKGKKALAEFLKSTKICTAEWSQV